MRILSRILCLLVCIFAAAVRTDEKPVAIPQKLAELLAGRGTDGTPVITPEQRAYFDGLNDHIKELLIKAVESETITRADHLGSILTLGLRPQKMEAFLEDNCILCHTDPEVQKPGTLFSLSPVSGGSPAHLNLRDLVDDVHFRRGLSCAGCHGGDPGSEKLEHAFVKEWPGTGRDKDRGWILSFCARCHADQSTGGIPGQRARPGPAGAWRSGSAGVQQLSRQSRCDARRPVQRESELRALPRGQRQPV